MKPDFLIDVDEVLADFVGPAAEIVAEVLGRPWGLHETADDNWDMFAKLTDEQKAQVLVKTNAKGFCAGLKPKDGALDFVRSLRRRCNVYAVTSPQHSPHWVFERTEWLEDFFEFDRNHVVHTDAKFLCRGDFFLDDNPNHVQRWSERHTPGGYGMLWTTSHNQKLKGHDKLRVYSWDEVLKAVHAGV